MKRAPARGDARPRSSSTIAAVLAQMPYFASLPMAEVRRLAGRCRVRSLERGDVLFEEGQPCRGLFIVAEGGVEVRQTSLRGREQVFHSEGRGATLGEGPLFDRGGYIATAVATEATRVLLLDRADLLDLCRRHPSVALAMLETLARRVRHFAEIVGDLAFRPVVERLARHLDSLGQAASPGSELDLQLTQSQLAARLGTVRELVARAFAQLEAAGMISRRRDRVVIRDPARLSAVARGERTAGQEGGAV